MVEAEIRHGGAEPDHLFSHSNVKPTPHTPGQYYTRGSVLCLPVPPLPPSPPPSLNLAFRLLSLSSSYLILFTIIMIQCWKYGKLSFVSICPPLPVATPSSSSLLQPSCASTLFTPTTLSLDREVAQLAAELLAEPGEHELPARMENKQGLLWCLSNPKSRGQKTLIHININLYIIRVMSNRAALFWDTFTLSPWLSLHPSLNQGAPKFHPFSITSRPLFP